MYYGTSKVKTDTVTSQPRVSLLKLNSGCWKGKTSWEITLNRDCLKGKTSWEITLNRVLSWNIVPNVFHDGTSWPTVSCDGTSWPPVSCEDAWSTTLLRPFPVFAEKLRNSHRQRKTRRRQERREALPRGTVDKMVPMVHRDMHNKVLTANDSTWNSQD